MSPLCYIAFIKWSFDDESMSLTASGMKLLYSLVVCQQILGYLLSACSRVDRLWLGGCSFSVYFGLCADITLYWCHWCSVDGSPVILWVQDLSRKAGNWVERLTNLPLAAQSLAGKSFSFLSSYMYFSFQQMKDPPRFQRHSKLYCCDCLFVTKKIFFLCHAGFLQNLNCLTKAAMWHQSTGHFQAIVLNIIYIYDTWMELQKSDVKGNWAPQGNTGKTDVWVNCLLSTTRVAIASYGLTKVQTMVIVS